MESTNPSWALIVAGGDWIDARVLERIGEPKLIVAADSGLDQAYRLNLEPDIVVGDMDSVSVESLRRAKTESRDIRTFPEDKDATDLELAIDVVVDAGFSAVTVVGGAGGRLAHTLANALLLTRHRDIDLVWLTATTRINRVVAGQTSSYLRSDGPLLSILPLGEDAHCRSQGLRWPLAGRPLRSGETRGVSNEITAATASLTVETGDVLVVQEHDDE